MNNTNKWAKNATVMGGRTDGQSGSWKKWTRLGQSKVIKKNSTDRKELGQVRLRYLLRIDTEKR